MTTPLALSDTVPDSAREVILAGIRAHNDTLLGPTDRRDLFIPLTDADGQTDGGLVGYTGRGWLFVELLLVPDRLRGRGMAVRLLEMAEQEARARGCIGAYIDTINPIARRAYERAGFQVFGRIENFASGLEICWLIKRYDRAGHPAGDPGSANPVAAPPGG
jgi:GNAT superfamily N-acetyltransferase